MNQKKGFTLIELLAVIVILAIIALIAVPVIMNIINKANKSAFKDTAYGIIQAGELYYAEQLLEPNGMTSDVTITLPDTTKKLQIKGEVPDGSILITKEGKVAIAVQNGRYCVTKGLDNKDITVTEDIENCTLPSGGEQAVEKTLSELAVDKATISLVDGTQPTEVVKPACLTDETICTPGTPVAIQVNSTDIYRFYVISETENKVTLIMDRNLYGSSDLDFGNVPWATQEDYGYGDSWDGGSVTDKGPITAIAKLKERTSTWSNISEQVYTYSDDGGKNRYESFQETMKARMLTYTEANKILSDNNNTMPSWMYINLKNTGDSNTDGYWLSATDDLQYNYAFYIEQSGIIINDMVWFPFFGIRPVITLTK